MHACLKCAHTRTHREGGKRGGRECENCMCERVRELYVSVQDTRSKIRFTSSDDAYTYIRMRICTHVCVCVHTYAYMYRIRVRKSGSLAATMRRGYRILVWTPFPPSQTTGNRRISRLFPGVFRGSFLGRLTTVGMCRNFGRGCSHRGCSV